MLLFHVTDRRHLPEIFRVGIVPTPNRRTKHGNVNVWLSNSLEAAVKMTALLRFKRFEKLKEPVVLAVNTDGLRVYLFHSWKHSGIREIYTPHTIKSNRIVAMISLAAI